MLVTLLNTYVACIIAINGRWRVATPTNKKKLQMSRVIRPAGFGLTRVILVGRSVQHWHIISALRLHYMKIFSNCCERANIVNGFLPPKWRQEVRRSESATAIRLCNLSLLLVVLTFKTVWSNRI